MKQKKRTTFSCSYNLRQTTTQNDKKNPKRTKSHDIFEFTFDIWAIPGPVQALCYFDVGLHDNCNVFKIASLYFKAGHRCASQLQPTIQPNRQNFSFPFRFLLNSNIDYSLFSLYYLSASSDLERPNVRPPWIACMLYATWTIFSGLVSLGFHRTCTHTFSKFPFLQTDQFTLFNTPDTSTEYRLYQPKTKKEIKNTTHPSLSLNRHHLSHFLYIPLETPPPTFAKVITPFVLSYDEQCCIFSQHA